MAVIGDEIIISGDAHFAEPPDLFQTRLPHRLRDRAPHAVRTPEGEFWISGNLRNPVGGSVGGYQAPDFRAAIKAGYGGAPGSVWDPAARLEEQDRDTIAAEVLYSSWGLFLFGMDDDDVRAECFTVFNDWAGEYCANYPNRLKGVGLCDVTDASTAVRHLEQIKRLGLNGALIAARRSTSVPITSTTMTRCGRLRQSSDSHSPCTSLPGQRARGCSNTRRHCRMAGPARKHASITSRESS